MTQIAGATDHSAPPLPDYPALTSCGVTLDTSDGRLRPLRSSADVVDEPAELRRRMDTDGYLYLPGYLDREQVLAARAEVVARLADAGHLAPGTEPDAAVAHPSTNVKFAPELAKHNQPLETLLYDGRMITFFERLLGGEVRHFDYTWLRAVSPGRGTAPHGDAVFMNRGTTRLYTAWVPLGDVDFTLGGLMILGKSHRLEELKEAYLARDVDAFCENEADAALLRTGEKWWNGSLSEDPAALQRQIGLPWLTAEFRAGDLLTFSIQTIHCSLDNHSDRIRLSSDSRYQLASEPIDERWIGDDPIGHGPDAKRGMIC